MQAGDTTPQPMTPVPAGIDAMIAPARAPGWRTALMALLVIWLALFVVFAGDWAAMVRQWWDISTYNHMLLIPPVEIWLVWQRRAELARLRPSAWWPGLFLFAGAALVWVLGGVSGLDLARQAGVVAMLAASVPLVLGPRVAAALLFPLFYLAFLIPFGEELVKPLQMITAKITIALTHASGIPAVIDGVFIDTPVGLFEVAEACSGVKFLIAMVAFGVLAANVCFLSWRRRIALLAACLVVPVLANGIRAWGTIYAAQFFGIEVAAGFDHIVYGWFFFAIVLALVIAGAWRFFDRPLDAPMVNIAPIANSALFGQIEAFGKIPVPLALAGSGLLVAGGWSWAFAAAHLAAPLPDRIYLPEVHGWTRVAYVPRVWWEPRAQGADHRLLGRYRDSEGHVVDVFVALYRAQGEGREAGGFGQGALMSGSDWSWQGPATGASDGRGERLLANGTVERVCVTWYRTGELLSGSNLKLKLAVIEGQFFLRAQPTAMLILSSEGDAARGTGDPDSAKAPEEAISRFEAAIGPIDAWMDAITGRK